MLLLLLCRFHVDAHSSAHVYLRLPEGMGIDDIPADTLEDAAQITKANSIQGEGWSMWVVGGGTFDGAVQMPSLTRSKPNLVHTPTLRWSV